MNIQTNIISTVAGNGQSGYSGDGGPAKDATISSASVTFDAKGRMYIAQYGSDVIRAVDPLGLPTSITVSSGSGQTTAVNTGFDHHLVALVRDSHGYPVPGVSGQFHKCPFGSIGFFVAIRTTIYRRRTGTCDVNATANTVVGSYTVYGLCTRGVYSGRIQPDEHRRSCPHDPVSQQPTDTSAGSSHRSPGKGACKRFL